MKENKTIFASRKAMLPLALLVMFFWGSLFPMIKVGYAAFQLDTSFVPNIMLFAGVRFVLCGLILVVSLGVSGKTMRPPEKTEWMPVLMIALFGYFLHYVCTYTGLSMVESSKTAILKQVGSLFIICFAFLLPISHVLLFKKDTVTHSSILAWRISWTEESGGLQSVGSQRVRHDRVD